MNDATGDRLTRKFKEPDVYDQQSGAYYLLPFRLHRFNKQQEVLVNEVGDYLITPTGTVERIISRQVDKRIDYRLYADLLSGFFIAKEAIPPLIDIAATRYKTKKSFLDRFTSLHIFVALNE